MNIEPSLETINQLTKIADDLVGATDVSVIFEFGSRYGEDTIVFAKKYPQAIVYAFECNPNTLALCKENIQNFENIRLTEKAVSNVDGPVSFFKIDQSKTQTTWADGNQGASSLLQASGKYPVENYVQEEIKVESTTLFAFMAENNLDHIDILWMDIQGSELLALQGLAAEIARVKVIHMEVEFFEIYKDQPLFNEILNFLEDKGFELIGFTSSGEYAGDAIFINQAFAPHKKITYYKKMLTPKQPSILKRVYNRLKRS